MTHTGVHLHGADVLRGGPVGDRLGPAALIGMSFQAETKRAASALAELGCDIVTGGGPGLMQAANEGAAASPERARSVGIRVALPFA